MTDFTPEDIKQMEAKGICPDTLDEQLRYFREGFPFLPVERAATPGDGILRFSENEAIQRAKAFNLRKKNLTLLKFVPASGAASRMFKNLFEFIQENKQSPAAREVLNHLDKFAFAKELKKKLRETGISLQDHQGIIRTLLGSEGLGYGSLPKALLTIHAYAEETRTPLEEHLTEGALYAANQDESVILHFTVSPEHQSGFEQKIAGIREKYEQRHHKKFNISFSQQKPSTDTIAADHENKPFRNSDGSLLFRPGGHGALLHNLNQLNADLIFIKNIDNVVPDRLKEETVLYKILLADVLLEYQKKVFEYLLLLEKGPVNAEEMRAIRIFTEEKLLCGLPAGFDRLSQAAQQKHLADRLNRPIRVCGMVKNEGEPGGGPFWVKHKDGSSSLQIAESSQISPDQQSLIASSTHFNPVDLVCGIKDYKGNKFDLMKFRDPDTGFISLKSKDGKELKAQELPGLWNGSMAYWNTLFVEVPVITFNPVKTVNDLLRPEHQP